ncbi:MAG: hypothetical protein JSV03_09730 [Planctomycetota bacterium]|nr:MAG: hypothetical protein JSV03_09730 [Planctomycetota bacterium]
MKIISSWSMLFIVVLLAPCGCASNKAGFAGYPDFSWDKVPEFGFLSMAANDHFTQEQAEYLARHFPLVAVCKRQRAGTEQTVGREMYLCAKAIKKVNPGTKVIVYLNTVLDYPGTSWGGTFREHPDWALKNKRGEDILIRKRLKVYDQSNPQVREWWTDVCAVLCGHEYIDGIFADTVCSIGSKTGLGRTLSEGKHDSVLEGMHLLFEQAREKAGPEKLIIFNGLRGDLEAWDGGLSYFEHTSGAIVEHFGAFSGRHADGSLNAEWMAADIELIRKAARMGKIVLVKGWPGNLNWISKEFKSLSEADRQRILKERITFPLAAFLIAAEKYCYFEYSFGYLASHGLFQRYPEYDKPLGPPQGPANRKGWIYTREFKHASVWVDLENEKAEIDWHNWRN